MSKHLMIYDEIKRSRDLAFLNIQFSSKYVSKFNKDITLNQAYINKDIIKKIGKATGKFPTGQKKGIYDFIDQTK